MILYRKRYRHVETGEVFESASVQVVHKLRRELLVRIVAGSRLGYSSPRAIDWDPNCVPTVAELMDEIRVNLLLCGSLAADQYDHGDKERLAWAERQVQRLWPQEDGEHATLATDNINNEGT
jgi:hypothetical protein